MRTLQLVMLALLPTAARADLIVQFSGSITGELRDGTPFSEIGECPGGVEMAFTICNGSADYGTLSLLLVAAGSGPDNGPKLFAKAEGTVGFTDRIIFYGPAGKTATVVWDLNAALDGNFSDTVSFDVNLPSAITFNVPYDMSAMMSNTVGAGAGEDENSSFSSLAINGFGVFGPTCDSYSAIFGSYYDPACGPPMDVSIHTQSGFLYGGHVPEPSTLLLLATAAGIAGLVSGRRRTA